MLARFLVFKYNGSCDHSKCWYFRVLSNYANCVHNEFSRRHKVTNFTPSHFSLISNNTHVQKGYVFSISMSNNLVFTTIIVYIFVLANQITIIQ